MANEFKFYSWVVSMDDGSRFTYEFEMHRDDPWTEVLRKFGKFLATEGFVGAKERIEDLCDEFERELDSKIQGVQAMQKYHGKELDN